MEQRVWKNEIPASLANVHRRYIVLSGKGGVGKSTVAAMLSSRLVRDGARVGLLDVDLHGPSIPTLLGLRNRRLTGMDDAIEPVSLHDGRLKVVSVQFMLDEPHGSVIWRGPLKHNVIAQLAGSTAWGELDYFIIDSPPGTGDEPLSAVRTTAPHGAIVVTTPQDMSTLDVRKSIDFCRKLDLPVAGVIENMSGFICPHCQERTNIFGSGGGEKMAQEMGVTFLGAVPINAGIVADGDAGRYASGDTCNRAAEESITAIASRLRDQK